MGIADDLYSGAADFGKITNFLISIFITILCIIAIIFSISLFYKENKYTKQIKAIIIQQLDSNNITNCILKNKIGSDGKETQYYQCLLCLKYTINNTEYKSKITIDTDKTYLAGEEINIYYNPNNPIDIQYNYVNPKMLGIIILSISAFILLITWVINRIVNRYKFAAAASGVSNAVKLIF